MDEQNTAASPRRTPRWVKITLGASLALNLLFIGLAGGAVWRVAKSGGPPDMRNGFAFVSALEPEDRRAVLSELRKTGKLAHAQARSDMQSVLATLRAESLDTDALQVVIERQIERGAAFQSRISAEWMARVAKMDHAARLAYADRLEERLKRGRRGPRHRSKD